MTRQEVEAGIAASEARSAALFARLDERTQAAVLRVEAKLDQAIAIFEGVARNAEASAERAEASAERAEASVQRAEASVQRAEASARRAEEAAVRAEEAAVRASHASYAYFLSLIAVAVGLYFGLRQANKEMFDAYAAVTRAEMKTFAAEVHATVGVLQGIQLELDRQHRDVVRDRAELELDRERLQRDKQRTPPAPRAPSR